jgi:anti-sigma B factor antagonist
VTTERCAGGAVVHAAGDVDLICAEGLRDALAAARSDGATLVIDVSDVEFIDSSGLHVLEAEHAESVRSGHTFVVAGARGPVLKTLRVAGFDTAVRCAPDWRAAMAGQ